MQNTTLNYFKAVNKTCEYVIRMKVEQDFNSKSESRRISSG